MTIPVFKTVKPSRAVSMTHASSTTAARAATPRIYSTVVPGHAAYLIVTARAELRYIGAEFVGNGCDVVFSFEDPEGLGPKKIEEFRGSILREYSEVHKFLRSEIGRVMRAAGVRQ
jgi:hypothetical protein